MDDAVVGTQGINQASDELGKDRHSGNELSPARLATANSIETLIFALVDRFNAIGISLCLLRNRDSIPFGLLDGGDIDFAVSQDVNTDLFLRVIADFGMIHTVRRREILHTYLQVDHSFLLQVDFRHIDPEWRGAVFLPSSDLFRDAQYDRGLLVASEVHQALIAWFDTTIVSGRFKQRYADLVVAASERNPALMRTILKQAFGKRLGDEYWSCATSGDPGNIGASVRRSRRVLWWRSVLANPVDTIHGFLDHYWQEALLRLRRRPAGLLVAILGPDGSGKSSVCQSLLSPPRASLPFASVSYQHLYRPVLPALSGLRQGHWRRSSDSVFICTDPHGKSRHGVFLSTVRMFYFLFDQWLSELRWGCHQLAKNQLRLHDRHIVEILVDPARYRFGGPRWLAGIVARLAPRPHLVILLDAPVDVLRHRKQEVSPEETHRQRAAYREFVDHLSSGHIVDATQPLEHVVGDVRRIIISFLQSRTIQELSKDREQ